ncbi:MAG: hypothetical protein AAGA90_20740 [Actinomycetota bacterium]
MPLSSTLLRPLRIATYVAILTLALPVAVLATPRIDAVSPTTVADGDVLILDGAGFLPDASRYSVVLRDAQGLAALGEVIVATPQTLKVVIHRLGRGSSVAEVVLHEGVRLPLVGPSMATVSTESATWFHGSGVTAAAGPVVVLAPTTEAPKGESVPIKPGTNGEPCVSGVFTINIPLDCSEITATIRVGGDDPFDGLPSWWPGERGARKAYGSIHDLWAATWTGHLKGRALQDSSTFAKALAGVLSEQFRVFGIEATAEEDPQGMARVQVHGERITATTGAALVSLRCVAP